jgi:glycosyltransferase involved in cell wall biosynthesis
MAHDSKDFIHQVNQLLFDANLRRQVGEKGLNIAQQRFSWESITSQLDHYLNENYKT